MTKTLKPTPNAPTNLDDSFVAGWEFGRKITNTVTIFPASAPTHVKLAYERGVAEGAQFRRDWNAAVSSTLQN